MVTIGLFNLLVHAGPAAVLASRPVTAYVVAMLAGLAVNYAGNKFWTFPAARASTRWTEIAAFLAVNAVAVAIPSLCLGVSRYALGLGSVLADNVSANGVGLVLATLTRWLAYRHVVFARREP